MRETRRRGKEDGKRRSRNDEEESLKIRREGKQEERDRGGEGE